MQRSTRIARVSAFGGQYFSWDRYCTGLAGINNGANWNDNYLCCISGKRNRLRETLVGAIVLFVRENIGNAVKSHGVSGDVRPLKFTRRVKAMADPLNSASHKKSFKNSDICGLLARASCLTIGKCKKRKIFELNILAPPKSADGLRKSQK